MASQEALRLSLWALALLYIPVSGTPQYKVHATITETLSIPLLRRHIKVPSVPSSHCSDSSPLLILSTRVASLAIIVAKSDVTKGNTPTLHKSTSINTLPAFVLLLHPYTIFIVSFWVLWIPTPCLLFSLHVFYLKLRLRHAASTTCWASRTQPWHSFSRLSSPYFQPLNNVTCHTVMFKTCNHPLPSTRTHQSFSSSI